MSVLDSIPSTATQAVLNDAVRLIFGRSRLDHITPILRDHLHWLSAPHIEFKVALLVYKAHNNLAPDYIAGYYQSSSINQCQSILCSAEEGILMISKTVTKFSKQSFTFAGPHL